MDRICRKTSSRSNVERIAWLASYRIAVFCMIFVHPRENCVTERQIEPHEARRGMPLNYIILNYPGTTVPSRQHVSSMFCSICTILREQRKHPVNGQADPGVDDQTQI